MIHVRTYGYLSNASRVSPKSVGLELLGQGRKLADGLKQKLCAVVIAKDVDEAVKEAGEYGADKIYVVKGDEYENYSADAYGNVF